MSIWSRLTAAVHDFSSAGSDFAERVVEKVAGSEEERRAVAFTAAIVALSAKMAKADGVVTSDEILAFKRNVLIPPHEEKNVARLFRLAQQDIGGYETYARRIAGLFPNDKPLRGDIIDVLFKIATADGVVHDYELVFLERVADIFGIGGVEFRRIKARHVREDANDPYLVLGVSPDADADTLKRHYRRLVVEYHPDRMIARGVPPEFIEVANDRMAAINAAYEQIERERGL